jgi:hypothetical protein
MKKLILLAGAILLTACNSVGMSGGWKDMSGSFDGWNQIGDANWRIEGDEFVADSGNGHLVTEQSYGDVQIQLEFWVDVPANSGVFMRASDPTSVTQSNAYEVNIFDTREDQTYRTGAIVEFAAPSEVIMTNDRWNTYDITMDGDQITVVLNGITTVEMEDDTYASGPISLQYGAGVVKFRNVRIREL